MLVSSASVQGPPPRACSIWSRVRASSLLPAIVIVRRRRRNATAHSTGWPMAGLMVRAAKSVSSSRNFLTVPDSVMRSWSSETVDSSEGLVMASEYDPRVPVCVPFSNPGACRPDGPSCPIRELDGGGDTIIRQVEDQAGTILGRHSRLKQGSWFLSAGILARVKM